MQENLRFRSWHEMNIISLRYNFSKGNILSTFNILVHFFFLCYTKIALCILLIAYVNLEYNSVF